MTTIRVGQGVQLLYAKGWGPGCLANTDLVNPVFFGHSRALDSSSDQIPALGAIPVDGSRDIYGSTLAGGTVIAVQSMPGITNWAPSPAQVSAQINTLGLAKDTSVNGLPGTIAVTGVPPLVFKQVLSQGVGVSLPHASSITRPVSGKISFNQPAYEFWFNIATLGATAPVISVELQWFDSATGARTDDELYYFYSGNASAHFIHGRGPTKGDQLVFIMTNYSATIDATISWVGLQTSRTFSREFWHTIGQGATQPVYPGFTAAASDISANVLASESHAIAASSFISVILPLYTGTVRIMATTTDPAAGNSKWTITAVSDQVTPNVVTFEGLNGQSGFAPFGVSSLYAAEIALPRGQCQLQMQNANTTTSETLTTAIVAQEDRA